MPEPLLFRVTVFLPAVLGLAVFAGAHVMLPPQAPLRVFTPSMAEPEPAAEDVARARDRSPRHYLRLQQNIASTIPALDGIVQVQIALAVSPQDEAAMLAALQERPETLFTPMQEVLRQQAEQSPDLASLHASLPPALRAAANLRLGTPDRPEPVIEVLITSLLLSQ